MRAIKKRKDSCVPFERWKKRNKGKRYQDLQDKAVKQALRASLVGEQKGLCCYCCCELKANHEYVVIEHFRPQDKYPDLTLDYQNLHASCKNEKSHNRHCAASKGNADPDSPSKKIISPLDPECGGMFTYLLDGSIQPAKGKNEKKAENAINILNLNSTDMVWGRKFVIDAYLQLGSTDWPFAGADILPNYYNVIEFMRDNFS